MPHLKMVLPRDSDENFFNFFLVWTFLYQFDFATQCKKKMKLVSKTTHATPTTRMSGYIQYILFLCNNTYFLYFKRGTVGPVVYWNMREILVINNIFSARKTTYISCMNHLQMAWQWLKVTLYINMYSLLMQTSILNNCLALDISVHTFTGRWHVY